MPQTDRIDPLDLVLFENLPKRKKSNPTSESEIIGRFHLLSDGGAVTINPHSQRLVL